MKHTPIIVIFEHALRISGIKVMAFVSEGTASQWKLPMQVMAVKFVYF